MSGRRTTAALVLLAALAAGCTTAPVGEPAPGDASDPAPVSTSGATPTGAQITWTTVVRAGTLGGLTYEVTVPVLVGGDAALVTAVNAAVDTSLEQVVARSVTDDSLTTLTGFSGNVTHLGERVISLELPTSTDQEPRLLNPDNNLATFVFNTATAEPILVSDLFLDPARGLARLSDLSRTQLSDVVTDDEGLSPVAENFAHWLPDPYGIRITFDEYQVAGNGNPGVRFSWSQLEDVMDPDVLAVVSS